MAAIVSKFEDALQFLINALKAVNGAPTYQSTIQDVKREYTLPHQVPADQMPFLGIAGTRRRLARDADQVVGSYAWDFTAYLHVFASAGATLSKVEADVETVLEADRTLGDMVDHAQITDAIQTTEIKAVNFAMGKIEIGMDVEHEEGDVTT